MHCWSFDAEGVPRLCVGPHWLPFLCLATVMLGFGIGFMSTLAAEVSVLNFVVGALLFVFLYYNYACAALKNPGIMLAGYAELPDSGSSHLDCHRCKIPTNELISHCYDCDVCIYKLDHHCPWTSKCIGQGNISNFYGFLAGLAAVIIYTVVTVALHFHQEINKN